MLGSAAAPIDLPVTPSSTAVDPWLTLEQAARRAQVHDDTCRRAIKGGKLRAIRINGGRVLRIRTSWLDLWLETYSTT